MAVVVILLLLAFVIVALRHPANAVALTFCVYAFEQLAQAHVPFFATNSSFLNFFFALLVVMAFVARGLRGERVATGISQGTLLLASIYAMHPFSILWTPEPEVTLRLLTFSLPYIVMLTFVTPLLIDGPQDLRRALTTLWALGSVVLLLILFSTEFAASGRGIALEQVGELKKQTGNPLAVASLGGTVAIIAAVMLPLKGAFGRLVVAATAMLGLYACVRTGSRGQFYGAIIMIGCAFVIQLLMGQVNVERAVAFVAAGAVALTVTFVTAVDQFGKRFELSTMRETYMADRIGPSGEMLQHWAAGGPWSWAFGLGGSASYHYVGFYPHMVPAEVLSELGLVGFTAYVSFAVISLLRLRWLLRALPKDLSNIALCSGTLFGFEAVMALKQGALLGCDYMMCHGLIICGVAQVWAYRTADAKPAKPTTQPFLSATRVDSPRLASATQTTGSP